MINLTESNFLLFAAQNYNSPFFDDDEFIEDLKRFKYLKRLFNQYYQKKHISERLILNHIIILSNVFNIDALIRMLVLKLPEYLPYLKPFLIYLSYYKPVVYSINGLNIQMDTIKIDQYIMDQLNKI